MTRLLQEGFTLVELVIVLLILGFLVAGILGPLSVRIEQKERQRAQERLEEIRDAIYGFAITYGRLPCPDSLSNDGKEDLVGTFPTRTCQNLQGNIPWQDLQVVQNDPWGNSYLYRVTGSFADESGTATFTPPSTCTGSTAAHVSFAVCSEGNMSIFNRTGGTKIIDKISAIVISRGKHALPAEDSTDEKENTDADNVFVYRDFSQASGSEFDDLMIWISPNILKYRMVQAGRLP